MEIGKYPWILLCFLLGSFQSRDASGPIADKQKYLMNYKHIHNRSSYLTGHGFTKGENLKKQNEKREKKLKNR